MCDWYCPDNEAAERKRQWDEKVRKALNKLPTRSLEFKGQFAKGGVIPPKYAMTSEHGPEVVALDWGRSYTLGFAEYSDLFQAERLLLLEWLSNLHHTVTGKKLENINSVAEIRVKHFSDDDYSITWRTLEKNDRGGLEELWHGVSLGPNPAKGYRLPEFLRRKLHA